MKPMNQGEMVRLYLDELLSSTSSPHNDERNTNSLDAFLLQSNATASMDADKLAESAELPPSYCLKLRSHSSFPAATTSDTTSPRSDMSLDATYSPYSLSDGDGDMDGYHCDSARTATLSGQRRGQSRANLRANRRVSPSTSFRNQRSYECPECGLKCPTGQSLGGHKNLHKNKGRNYSKGKAKARIPITEPDHALSTPYRGVRCRDNDKWCTEIRPPKSQDVKWWLGTYPSAEEAAQAYDVALCYFRSDTPLNFGYHELYSQLPTIPTGLSSQEYADELRKVVKDFSQRIIAARRQGDLDGVTEAEPHGDEQAVSCIEFRPVTPDQLDVVPYSAIDQIPVMELEFDLGAARLADSFFNDLL